MYNTVCPSLFEVHSLSDYVLSRWWKFPQFHKRHSKICNDISHLVRRHLGTVVVNGENTWRDIPLSGGYAARHDGWCSDLVLGTCSSCEIRQRILAHLQIRDFPHRSSLHHNHCTLELGWPRQLLHLRESLNFDANELASMNFLEGKRFHSSCLTRGDLRIERILSMVKAQKACCLIELITKKKDTYIYISCLNQQNLKKILKCMAFQEIN